MSNNGAEKTNETITYETKTWKFQLQIHGITLKIQSRRRTTLDRHPKASSPKEKTQVTLTDYLLEWLNTHRGSRSARTILLYETVVHQLINPIIGNLDLAELQADTLQSFYKQLQHEFGQSTHTVNFTHTVLRAALNHAKKLGLLSKNPCELVKAPKHSISEMGYFDESQARQFLQTAQNLNDRFFPLYYLAIHTGMRMAELIGLKWQDINWNLKTLHVQRQVLHPPGGGFEFSELKSKSARRTIILGTKTISVLGKHKETVTKMAKNNEGKWTELDLVFPSQVGTPVPKSNVRRNFYRTLKASELPKIRFHDLRHTSATLLLNHGIPVLIVSRRLGHAKPSVTMDVYGHVIPGKQEEAASLLDELLSSGDNSGSLH